MTEFRSDGGQLPPINVNSGVDINPPRSFDFREALPEYNHLSTASQCPASPSPWTYNIVSPTLYHGSSDPSLWLPPIDELVPIIDHYFHAISPSLPLFSQPLFMRTLTTFLSPSSTSPCDRTTWSSILVVTALSLQSDYPAHIPPAKRKVWIDYCMRNAQSVLPELMARHEDLLGLQVILGLTMLFRSAVNLRPASMLASIAVRLAYQMQLYRKDTMQYFSEEEALQRVDVFWVTYVLDMVYCPSPLLRCRCRR